MAITKIGTPELFDFSSLNTALQLPTGTTAERPGTLAGTSAPVAGEWRFNTTLKYVEYWDGGAWRQIDTEALPNSDDFPSQNFNVNTYIGNGATQAIDAKFNEAANFNGSSSKIDIASTITGNNSFSVSFWLNPTANNITPFMMGSASTGQAFLTFVTGNTLNFGRGGDSLGSTTSNTIPNNTWTHIAVSSNAGSVTVYVNGVSNLTFSTTYNISSGGTFIGYASGYSQYFKGKIDQVRIFNTAITAAQAEDLYTDETTTTAATLDFPVGAGCFAAYQLDGDASDISGTYGGVTTDIGYTGLRFQPDFVWIKARDNGSNNHLWTDSIRGVGVTSNVIGSNLTSVTNFNFGHISAFDLNGFTVAQGSSSGNYVNSSSATYVAWCWKAGGAPTATNSAGAGNVPTAGSVKIDGADSTTALAGTLPAKNISANTAAGFSIVKYEGSGATATVGHGLGSIVELLIVKGLETTNDWSVLSKDNANGNFLQLNGASGQSGSGSIFGSPTARPTNSVFTIGNTGESGTNGKDYVAYCFHSVSGFSKVGSYTGNTANPPIVSTGFEPAFLMIKATTINDSWFMVDNKRETSNPRGDRLFANSSAAEASEPGAQVNFLANGFQITGSGGGAGQTNSNGTTYIYLAIAADKDTSVPTQANSFSPTIYTGNGGAQNIYTPFAPDFTWVKQRTGSAANHLLFDSIRGAYKQINSNQSYAETDRTSVDKGLTSFNSNGFTVKDTSAGDYEINGTNGGTYSGDGTYVSWNWKAGGLPTINNNGDITSLVSANVAGGFSIVKYTAGSATNQSIGHGLTNLTPKLVLIKKTSGTEGWIVWYEGAGTDNWLELNSSNQKDTGAGWGGVPTSTVVHLQDGGAGRSSANGASYIAYCFADITGYQKVGSYIGNGSTTGPIEATGFEPRYLLIKSADNSSTNWIILDKARTPNNPLENDLKANLSSVEQTGTGNNYPQATTSATGFQVNTTDGAVNGSGTYIYLAIA
jgi:hypothetical protein